jgi:hypothetical protein
MPSATHIDVDLLDFIPRAALINERRHDQYWNQRSPLLPPEGPAVEMVIFGIEEADVAAAAALAAAALAELDALPA